MVRTIFVLNLLAMILNIILNLILIPMFGIIGSAYATLISYMIIPLGVLILKYKKL
jgi:Na+-driven multidrug efflux pump